jgi:hypothetical protein
MRRGVSVSERLAAIRRETERTYSKASSALGASLLREGLLRGEPCAAEAALRGNGFIHLPGVLNDEVLLHALDEHITATEVASRSVATTTQHPSGSLLPPALEPQGRSDVLLDLWDTNDEASVVAYALVDVLTGPCGVRALLESCLGHDAVLWELSAMRSRPGAKSQPFHPDTAWQRPEPSAFVVWCALSDVTLSMGPTLLLPGTHRQAAHVAFDSAQGTEVPPDFAAAAAVGCEGPVAPLLRRGDVLVMDSRVLHCGLANRSGCERTLFYFTFRRRGDEDGEWLQSSLTQRLRNERNELHILSEALGGMLRGRPCERETSVQSSAQ